MNYFNLFRKGAFFLAVLMGIGSIVLFGKIYLDRLEERSTPQFPIESPTDQDKVASQPSEDKSQLVAEAVPKAMVELKIPEPAKESEPKGSVDVPPTKEFKPTLPSPNVEQKPASQDLAPERRSPASTPLKEVRKEPKSKVSAKKTIPALSVPQVTEPETNVPVKQTVIVKSGDSIYTIASKTYKVANTSLLDQILELNPKITNPDILLVNQKVRLPEITEESLVTESSDGTYQVRLGTFLKPEYSAFLKDQPELQGKEIEIIPRKISSGETWYRVMAGKFNSREEGLKVIHDLKEKGLSPYFVGFQQKME
jgi:nucleoid-associated protein YgaU